MQLRCGNSFEHLGQRAMNCISGLQLASAWRIICVNYTFWPHSLMRTPSDKHSCMFMKSSGTKQKIQR